MKSLLKEKFGTLEDGREVTLYRLENDQAGFVEVLDLGVTLHRIVVPNKEGKLQDVILGYDDLASYLMQDGYLGATVGRLCNRLAESSFELDGQVYKVDANEGINSLHGGSVGFDKKVWNVKSATDDTLVFELCSEDGDMGYPGTLNLTLKVTWSEDNELKFHYAATTDKPTVVNLTNHTYFNLSGEETILDHELTSPAKAYTPVDEELIPTGKIVEVKGTPFDLQKPQKLGELFKTKLPEGLDHNFVLTGEGKESELHLAGELYSPASGIHLKVSTTQPGVQIYAGGQLTRRQGKDQKVYDRFAGLCLETQHYPDSLNQADFPSVVLRPGEKFTSTTKYNFYRN